MTTLAEIKHKRLTEGKSNAKKERSGGAKRMQRLPDGSQVYASNESVEEQKHETPKFVQHCVSAITSDPEKLAKVQQRKNGSPFGICVAQYKKDKGRLAAKHSRGQHHTTKDFEKALSTLRESVERQSSENVDPRSVRFVPGERPAEAPPIEAIRFSPRG